jgi:hypothetical protein
MSLCGASVLVVGRRLGDGWATIEPYLPSGNPGKPRADDRRVISGILYVLKTGMPLARHIRPRNHDLQLLTGRRRAVH